MIKKKHIFILYSCILLLCNTVFAQQKFQNFNKGESKEQDNITMSIFNNIESGISSENVSEISGYLNTPTYLSLSNGISGYYSSNQAFYVLEDFFNIYKVTSFHFQIIQVHDNLPYATGIYKYYFRGKRDSANVYISLKQVGDSWKITQITIN